MQKIKVIIMGAAGRDFHNFNVYFRGNDAYEVVAFTATQIPGIEGRRYPTELAGSNYPNGIPIYSEEELAEWVPKIRALTEKAAASYVFANNHWEGQAVATARQLKMMLGLV